MSRRYVLYGRVSTEDQAERQTIQNQIRFAENWARLYQVDLLAQYLDEGVSGTIPLAERPAGTKLLADAKANRFDTVLVYRVDRLGRSVLGLIEAERTLSELGITIQSMTEPFDTSNPIGKFIFTLLGSLAELERSTINSRMLQGKARQIRDGKWITGRIPFGYATNENGLLVPSPDLVPPLGVTEAEFAVQIFERIANGETAEGLTGWINALDLPVRYRYPNGEIKETTHKWGRERIQRMIHNDLYVGERTVKIDGQTIIALSPPLVSRELAQSARATLRRNRQFARRNSRRDYLLRGLVRDEHGHRMSGFEQGLQKLRYYQCTNRSHTPTAPDGLLRCRSKVVPADELEDEIWATLRGLLADPGDVLEQARQELLARSADCVDLGPQLSSRLQEIDRERERLQVLFRRGLIELPEIEKQSIDLTREKEMIHGQLESNAVQLSLQSSQSSFLSSFEDTLAIYRRGLEIAASRPDEKRRIVETLIEEVTITTLGQDGPKKPWTWDLKLRLPGTDGPISRHSHFNLTLRRPQSDRSHN